MRSLLLACKAVLRREFIIAYRHRAEWLNIVLFFILIICLFPLSLNAQPKLLQTIAPGVIWVTVLLAIILSLDKLFRHDVIEGFLDQLMLNQNSLQILILVKLFAHWTFTCLPLIVLTPLMALLMHLNSAALIALCFTLLLGTPVLILVGSIFAALTVSLRINSLLLPLLILPFYTPLLIFGSGSASIAATGLAIHGQLAIMAAMLTVAIPMASWVTVVALRIAVE